MDTILVPFCVYESRNATSENIASLVYLQIFLLSQDIKYLLLSSARQVQLLPIVLTAHPELSTTL